MILADRMMSALRQAQTLLNEGGPDALDDYRGEVAAILRERFACSMATLWCVEGEPGSRRMVCVAALSDPSREDPAGTVLHEVELGDYFSDLLRDGLFNSPDALHDPRLTGLLDRYLRPQKVGALLDATARVNGEIVGIICIEQRGSTRVWTRNDELDLRRAIGQISLSMNRVKELARLAAA